MSLRPSHLLHANHQQEYEHEQERQYEVEDYPPELLAQYESVLSREYDELVHDQAAIHARAAATASALRVVEAERDELARQVAASAEAATYEWKNLADMQLQHDHLVQKLQPIIDEHAVRVEKSAAIAPGKSRLAVRLEKEAERYWIKTTDQSRVAAKMVAKEALKPVMWLEPAYRSNREVRFEAPHARLADCEGLLQCVSWGTKRQDAEVIAVFAADMVPITGRGRPVKHVGHIVCARSADMIAWTAATASQAAHHALVAIGVDPARHTWMAVLHSQRKGVAGAEKNEEAVHLVYSRIRDDGALHRCDHALVALAVGQSTWDNAAGVDPDRWSGLRGASQPVRDGLKALQNGKMKAYFTINGEKIETVDLCGKEHRTLIGAQGIPELDGAAGIWVPKQGYRTEAELQALWDHLFSGN